MSILLLSMFHFYPGLSQPSEPPPILEQYYFSSWITHSWTYSFPHFCPHSVPMTPLLLPYKGRQNILFLPAPRSPLVCELQRDVPIWYMMVLSTYWVYCCLGPFIGGCHRLLLDHRIANFKSLFSQFQFLPPSPPPGPSSVFLTQTLSALNESHF